MLTVISYAGKRNNKNYWRCVCDCGNYTDVQVNCLTSGSVKSCGCFQKQQARKFISSRYKNSHHLSKFRIYSIWTAMKKRCEYEKASGYLNYGGRGIKVCERWHSFENFLTDMGQPPTPEHSLDRIDLAGDYEPGNCRWSTIYEQANNKTNNIILTFEGKTQTLAQWSKDLGINYRTLYWRYFKKWSVQSVLSNRNYRKERN